jgi:hypothetical protein
MPHTIKDGQSFPLPCPACAQVAGIPFMAATHLESGGIKVAMRCRECQHEWRYDMPIKIDERRANNSHQLAESTHSAAD